MSRHAVTHHRVTLGVYGKVPVRGDFIVYQLPARFVDPWDRWLQSGLTRSQRQLGDDWLEWYLTCPMWRFLLSEGIFDQQQWLGVLMPSVDRVGRYYPLTLAGTVTPPVPLTALDQTNAWLGEVERLALQALSWGLDLDDWLDQLQRLDRIVVRQTIPLQDSQRNSTHSHLNYKCLPIVPAEPSTPSVWWKAAPTITYIQCTDLLPAAAFTALLTDDWQPFEPPNPVPSPVMTTNQPARDLEDFPMTPAKPIAWRSAHVSHVGVVRKVNEDACLDLPERGLWVVADGMGGHEAGDVASHMVVDALAQLPTQEGLFDTAQAIEACLKEVNQRLQEESALHYHQRTIGSTVAVLVARNDQGVCLWAGDSRVYQLHQGTLRQLSRDHSHVQDLVDLGLLHADLAHQHPLGNVITRAVGSAEDLDVDVKPLTLHIGDKFLLCSDGLNKVIGDAEIADILRELADPDEIVNGLLTRALSRHANDNVTAVVVEIIETSSLEEAPIIEDIENIEDDANIVE